MQSQSVTIPWVGVGGEQGCFELPCLFGSMYDEMYVNCISFSNVPHTSALKRLVDTQVFLSTNCDPGSVLGRCHFVLSDKESSPNRHQEKHGKLSQN